jgi:hypothetical protein
VEQATDRLNVMRKAGTTNTLEYRNAVRQLETATANLNSVQQSSTIMTAAMGLQTISMAASIATSIPELLKMTEALKQYNIVASITNALSGPGGWAKLAIGAGIGAAAVGGIMALQNSSQPKSQPITIEITNKDIIQDYLARTQGHNIKTLGAT